jgi:hypothetical protein
LIIVNNQNVGAFVSIHSFQSSLGTWKKQLDRSGTKSYVRVPHLRIPSTSSTASPESNPKNHAGFRQPDLRRLLIQPQPVCLWIK